MSFEGSASLVWALHCSGMELVPQRHADVLAAEEQFWDHAHQPGFLQDAFTPDALNVIEPLGIIPREEAIAMAKKTPGWTDVEMTELNVRELTPHCVALVHHATARRKVAESADRYRGTLCSVYVRRDDAWKLALSRHQPWKPGKD